MRHENKGCSDGLLVFLLFLISDVSRADPSLPGRMNKPCAGSREVLSRAANMRPNYTDKCSDAHTTMKLWVCCTRPSD